MQVLQYKEDKILAEFKRRNRLQNSRPIDIERESTYDPFVSNHNAQERFTTGSISKIEKMGGRLIEITNILNIPIY